MLQAKRDHELKKKQIADYKEKKAMTADLLANADLDYGDEDEDFYGDELNSNEADASKFLDQMLVQYAQKGNQRGQKNADMELDEDELLASA